MFFFRSPPNHPKATRPVTTAPAAQAALPDRTQRHLRLCEELADIGMQLARATAAEVLDAHRPPAQAPDAAEPPPPTTPGRAAAAAHLFTKLCRAVRQAILLEARIAADHQAALRAAIDPRRPDLRSFLHRLAATRPDGLRFKREAYERLEHELVRDPAATTPDVLATICHSLGVILDEHNTPDHFAHWVWPNLPPEPAPLPWASSPNLIYGRQPPNP